MRRALVFGVTVLVLLFVAGVFWAGDFLTEPARGSTGVPNVETVLLALTAGIYTEPSTMLK